MAGTKVIKIFLDASVLVAACASTKGASAFVLHLSRQRLIKAVISGDVLGETVKNVELKLGEIGECRLRTYFTEANLILGKDPEAEEIAVCEQVINQKDAPVLAAAIRNKAMSLLTLDRKHFFTSAVIKFSRPLKILTPGNFLKKYYR